LVPEVLLALVVEELVEQATIPCLHQLHQPVVAVVVAGQPLLA